MKYIRENGMYYFAECERCGKELKAMRAHCKKDEIGLEVDRIITCSCGESSNIIKIPVVKTEHTSEYEDSSDQIKCPKCNSTQITAGNKGFGLGKAAVGGLLLGPVGLLGGVIGSKKIMVTCLKCGKKWEAGKS